MIKLVLAALAALVVAGSRQRRPRATTAGGSATLRPARLGALVVRPI